MATINNINKHIQQPYNPPEIDINILEYIYAADFNDIFDDDDLMELIANNGYYQQAFCEAFDIHDITITVKDKQYKLSQPVNSPHTALDLINGNTPIIILGQTITDSSQ